MKKNKLVYFPEEDILHYSFSDSEEAKHLEINPNIIAELDENGELIGIEILEASSFLKDLIFDSVKAKLLNLKT